MKENYEIYQAPKADIPKEDIARFEGYIRGREEEAAIRRLVEEDRDKIFSKGERSDQ